MDKRITIYDLMESKRTGKKITALSCYDYTTAKLVSASDVDMILVGDSVAQVVLGHDSTLPVTMDFMVAVTAAVRRANYNVCLCADMPFLSYQTSISDAVKNAGRFFQEAGSQIVKIEVTEAHLDVIKAVSDAGMAVMAHIGIRPQSISKLGKFKAEGTTAELAFDLIKLAEKMEKAGAGSLLIEGTAREVAAIITGRAKVPVISCGSGPDCDGQILIVNDILGLSQNRMPKFSKNFTDLSDNIIKAVNEYVSQVRSVQFPDDNYCYHIKEEQRKKLDKMMSESNL